MEGQGLHTFRYSTPDLPSLGHHPHLLAGPFSAVFSRRLSFPWSLWQCAYRLPPCPRMQESTHLGQGSSDVASCVSPFLALSWDLDKAISENLWLFHLWPSPLLFTSRSTSSPIILFFKFWTVYSKDHGTRSHHFMANRWGNSGNSGRLFWGGSKITADGDCSHEIKTCLLLGAT